MDMEKIVMQKNMIIAGLGFTSSATDEEIICAIKEAFECHDLRLDDLRLLATIESKKNAHALASAAQILRLPLEFITREELERASKYVITQSQISIAATGLPSLSESAALAALNSDGRLLGPRTVLGPVTCALARSKRQQPALSADTER